MSEISFKPVVELLEKLLENFLEKVLLELLENLEKLLLDKLLNKKLSIELLLWNSHEWKIIKRYLKFRWHRLSFMPGECSILT